MSQTEEILNGLLVELFNDLLKIEENSLTDKNDLSITEIHTIEAIGIKNKKTMGEVANNLRITLGTLTTAINKLVKKGYVEREKDENDKRVVLLSLTQSGINIYNIHKKFHDEMIFSVMEEFKEDEREVLSRLLSKITMFFKEKYNKSDKT